MHFKKKLQGSLLFSSRSFELQYLQEKLSCFSVVLNFVENLPTYSGKHSAIKLSYHQVCIVFGFELFVNLITYLFVIRWEQDTCHVTDAPFVP